MNSDKYLQEAQEAIQSTYENGITTEKAEVLAGKFLFTQIILSGELKKLELSARMRKSGVKAIRAAVRLDEAKKGDKRPTEATLDALVDMNELVQKEQNELDIAEVDRFEYERLFEIYRDAHIYYRGIAKGTFNG